MDVTSWIAEWWAWSVPTTLQATLLLALAWIVDRLLLRRVWPQVLAIFWLLALARFFLPPDLRSPLSVSTSLGAPTLAAARFSPSAALLFAAFAVWLLGSASCFVARWVQRARLESRVEPVCMSREWRAALGRASRLIGTRAQPRIGTMQRLDTPAVFGLLRPTLLLPRSWLERTPTRRDEHALLHELAHLKRRDLWLDEVCACARALLWFHPLAWIAFDRLRALGELQCDQTAARALGSEARSYRDTLVLAARQLVLHPAPCGVRAFNGHSSAIIVRIECLEGKATSSPSMARGVSAALAFTLAACVLPMAPRAADLRAQALQVFAAERSGQAQSCFIKHAAAMVLAADSKTPTSKH